MSEFDERVEEFVDKHGRCYDFEISPQEFDELKENLSLTDRTFVTRWYPNAESYRDGRSIKSIHVTDYRGMEREDKVSDIIVCHIENFNPEHHPILHLLIDTPIWSIKNRILTRNNL